MENSILGLDFIHATNFNDLLIRFILNSVVILVIVRAIYYPIARKKDYLFSFALISTLIFLLTYMMESVEMQIGFAFGLFAIFGILRYRTDTIPIKEMTYLFVLIGISVINALAGNKFSLIELVFTNLVIIAIIFGLERLWLQEHELTKVVDYDNTELILPERKNELIVDLEKRTGLKINRVEVERIDLVKNEVKLTVYYKENGRKDKSKK